MVLLTSVSPLGAQQPGPGGACQFHIDSVGGLGIQAVVGADTNYYAGGFVQLSCVGTRIVMQSDSLVYFGRGRNTQAVFIGHVRYRDSTITMDAERGTYFRNGERWEARGNVVTTNLVNGSTMKGPSLDYHRAIPGIRDTAEAYAIGRPTINSYPQDAAGERGEPYVVVADRVRLKGNDRMWAGGRVTIDRSDFSAKGDSLYLDSGEGQEGQLVGTPSMRGLGRDSFELTGTRIGLALDGAAITYVTAFGDGHAVSADLDLVADTIGLDLENEQLVQTLAWGDKIRPRGVTATHELRGDSLAFDTPDQQLRAIRSFTGAWVGGEADRVGGERDWIAGDTIAVSLVPWDSAGTERTAVELVDARGSARSYYRVAGGGGPLSSINYSRGDQIIVRMKPAGQQGV
ncbi:MAG: hypothetical protein OEV95_12970, partial [Gemmatimonadota bacterium]|nr:hypothetical protein [Gemmatimonadota bacterium]